ncbi:glycosyltransferase [Desulfatibacillum aliphaticivorans]|uniref:glycosyltransferase n=1 Tax=Desulfatibacillum aliphaticivorans TaxID=218208 RepID=UPI000A01B135|nr:glycosyltransferase [Desulfatibacillum aliphaticivorans]
MSSANRLRNDAHPLVSVGVPVYNAVKTIGRTLDSLINQDYDNLEIIVSDNCSDDGTYELCKEYAQKDERIRIFRNDVNVGASENFRLVCNRATGVFFFWAASDDHYFPEFASVLVKDLENKPDAVVSLPSVVRESVEGKRLAVQDFTGRKAPYNLSRRELVYRIIAFQPKYKRLKYNFFILGLWRREWIADLNLRYSFTRNMERPFLAILAMKYRFSSVDRELMYKCWQNESFKTRNPDDPIATTHRKFGLWGRYGHIAKIMLKDPLVSSAGQYFTMLLLACDLTPRLAVNSARSRLGDLYRKVKGKIQYTLNKGPKKPVYTVEEKGAALKALLQRTTDMDLMLRVLETRRFIRPIKTDFVRCPEGDRLLFIAPHQDDAIIGCGGLILHAQEDGKTLIPIYVSDGMNFSPGIKPEDVPAVRKQEACKVWKTVGNIDPIFWDIPNKEYPITPELAQKLYDAIHEHKPDCLFIPFFLEDPDSHRKTNQLLYMAGQLGPLPELEVWAYQVTSMICPNVGVEISDVIEKKQHLMGMWKSQNAVFDYQHYSYGLNVRNSLFYRLGDKPKPHVELFFVVPMREYQELLHGYYGSGDEETIYGRK